MGRTGVTEDACPRKFSSVKVGKSTVMTLDETCVIVQSQRFPKNYPTQAFDRISEITFPPTTKCRTISLDFLDDFDLETGNSDCSGNNIDRLILTKIKSDGTDNGQIGKYCGSAKPDPMTEAVNLTEFAKLRVRFRNSVSTGSAAGFELRVCLR